jgi:hypothetical protein
VCTQIGPLVPNYCPPIPNYHNSEDVLFGIFNRQLRPTPQPSDEALRKLKREVRREVCSFLKHYHDFLVPDFDEWIRARNYPIKKKEMYRKAYEDAPARRLKQREKKISIFVKKEAYDTFKPARMIANRTKFVAAKYGPKLTTLEEAVFSFDWGQGFSPFIKKIPYADRPEHITECFSKYSHDWCFKIDYSAYENCFKNKFQAGVECHLYRKAFEKMGALDPEIEDFISVVLGPHKCNYKGFSYTVPEGRMSGDIITSLGNGFSNLMLIKFFMKKLNIPFVCFVEGDDCVVKPSRPLSPTEIDTLIDSAFELGFIATLEHVGHVNECNFLSTCWNPDTMNSYKDATRSLLRLGWSFKAQPGDSLRHKKQLFKAKLMSELASSPNCPVLAPICYKLLQELSDIRGKMPWNSWLYEELVNAGLKLRIRNNYILIFDHKFEPPDVKLSDRICYFETFGVDVQEQILIENETNMNQMSDRLAHHYSVASNTFASFNGL